MAKLNSFRSNQLKFAIAYLVTQKYPLGDFDTVLEILENVYFRHAVYGKCRCGGKLKYDTAFAECRYSGQKKEVIDVLHYVVCARCGEKSYPTSDIFNPPPLRF